MVLRVQLQRLDSYPRFAAQQLEQVDLDPRERLKDSRGSQSLSGQEGLVLFLVEYPIPGRINKHANSFCVRVTSSASSRVLTFLLPAQVFLHAHTPTFFVINVFVL